MGSDSQDLGQVQERSVSRDVSKFDLPEGFQATVRVIDSGWEASGDGKKAYGDTIVHALRRLYALGVR